jgi:hypothetical protein
VHSSLLHGQFPGNDVNAATVGLVLRGLGTG